MILVIINKLNEWIFYKQIKTIINTMQILKIIVDVIRMHYYFQNSIMRNRNMLFISKFLLSLSNFLKIKSKLSSAFYFQANCQIKRSNSIIKLFFLVFIYWEQNNYTKLLPITEFTYNSFKNVSINYILFEFNCEFHLYVIFEYEINLGLKSD